MFAWTSFSLNCFDGIRRWVKRSNWKWWISSPCRFWIELKLYGPLMPCCPPWYLQKHRRVDPFPVVNRIITKNYLSFMFLFSRQTRNINEKNRGWMMVGQGLTLDHIMSHPKWNTFHVKSMCGKVPQPYTNEMYRSYIPRIQFQWWNLMITYFWTQQPTGVGQCSRCTSTPRSFYCCFPSSHRNHHRWVLVPKACRQLAMIRGKISFKEDP